MSSSIHFSNDNYNDNTYEPTISKKICKLVCTKHNLSSKILKHFKNKLEELEIQHHKLNSDLINKLTFKNTLTKYQIYDIKKEFIEALTNPNYLERKLNNLEDIIFIPPSNASPELDEEQLKIELLDLCNKLMNYKDYLLNKLSSQQITEFSFNSHSIKGIKKEIKKWDENKRELYKRIVLYHTGYDFDEFITTYNLNYCNTFIRSKLKRVTSSNTKNSASLKHYMNLLDGNDHDKLMKTDKTYKNYIIRLTRFHERISNWKQNLTFVSKNEIERARNSNSKYKPNAFSQNLLDYSHAFDIPIEDILDETQKYYYMNNDIACRINSYYRRLTFDIDINLNSFNIAEFNQDIQFLFTFIFNKLSNHNIKVYFAVDISDKIDAKSIINCINNNRNIHSPALDIDVKYWVFDMKKDVSIHVYVTGVYFTEYVLHGMSKRIRELVNSKYLFYIDPAPYNKGTQQFRAPYSGKMIADRPPILRNTNYTKEELIDFYKNCSPFPDKDLDEYASEFDDFYGLSIEKQSNGYREIKLKKIVKELTKDAKPIERKVDWEDSSLYDDEIIDKYNGENILIDMMCEVINNTYGYQEHRNLRLIFINNMLAMGYNIETIRKFNESFGINHTAGYNTTNSQSDDDIIFVERETTYRFNENILNKNCKKDGHPIVFLLRREWWNILFHNVLSHSILKIIVKHIFVMIKSKQMFYIDDVWNEDNERYERVFTGPYESASQFGNYTLKLYSGDKIFKISPYDFITQNEYYYDYKSIGFYDSEFTFNSFTYNIHMKKIHKDFKELFEKVPELRELLRCITYNDQFSEEEAEIRIEYILKTIAYAVQKPGKLKQTALIFMTQQGSGKTKLFELLYDMFVGYVLKEASLQNILKDRFRNYLMNKVFICCEEIENNLNANPLKDFITNNKLQIESKGKDQISFPNTSLKLFATNNKQFDFITETERRFVIFEGTLRFNNKGRPYDRLLDDQKYRNESIDIIRDYLLSFDLGDFNFKTDKFIPKSCIATQNATAKNVSMKGNYDNHFIKCIFKNCVTATTKKDGKKVMTSKHLIFTMNTTFSLVRRQLPWKYLSEEEQGHYMSEKSYEKVYEFITAHYDTTKEIRWNENKITTKLGNDMNFNNKERPDKKSLNIPEIYDDYYSERPRIIKYIEKQK